MKLEPLRLAPMAVDEAGARQPSSVVDVGNKTARLPRWTKQEIILLTQGKRAVENRVRECRDSGSGQIEPKWKSVSSYCETRGMNRGPVQCRKRWSNLAGDFRKIKEWESSIKEETESFWVMRNDSRRERKLPGFFDREVYDILDGGGGGIDVNEEEVGCGLASAATAEAVVDDGLVSGFQSGQDEVGRSTCQSKETPTKDGPTSILNSVTERRHEPSPQESCGQGENQEKQPEVRSTREGRKRKRYGTSEEEEATNLDHQLFEALEKNGKLLSWQLAAHNNHLQLEREQSKGQMNSLITVLGKLADSLGKIADKL